MLLRQLSTIWKKGKIGSIVYTAYQHKLYMDRLTKHNKLETLWLLYLLLYYRRKYGCTSELSPMGVVGKTFL